MTREEAIKIIRKMLAYTDLTVRANLNADMVSACNLAIKALEQEPILDKIEAEIANNLQIMDICDVEKVNGVIVQSELTNRKVVLYDSVMRIIDKYKSESKNT